MPATVTATLLGTFKSIARAVVACNAGATSNDVLTVAHGLGACPDFAYGILRSVISTVSGSSPGVAARAWNASQTIFDVPPMSGGVGYAVFDLVNELVYSTNR